MVRLAEYSTRQMVELRKRSPASAFDGREQGTLTALPHAEAARPHSRRHRSARSNMASPTKSSIPRAASPPSPASPPPRCPSSAACAFPTMIPAIAGCSPSAWRASPRAGWSRLPLRHDHQGHPSKRRHRHGRCHRRGASKRPTPTSPALGSYSAAACSSPSASRCRSIPSRAIRSPCRSPMTAVAPVSTVMDETYKVATTRLRRPHPRRRHRRNRRLRPRPASPRGAASLDSLRELFPQAGDLGKASFWCGLQADDPRRHANPRPRRIPQPLPQHRPRHARLDHGGRRPAGSSPTSISATSPTSTSPTSASAVTLA